MGSNGLSEESNSDGEDCFGLRGESKERNFPTTFQHLLHWLQHAGYMIV